MSVYEVRHNREIQVGGSVYEDIREMSVYKDVIEEESRSQTQAETDSALLDHTSSSVETQSDTELDSDDLQIARPVNMTEEMPIVEGRTLSGSQTQADTLSAIPDKDDGFREAIQ
jgi:hypothetical protein